MSTAIAGVLRRALRVHADPEIAVGMQAYMKTSQFFYGIKTPVRRGLLRDALKKHPIEGQEAYEAAVRDLWYGKSREEMYLAVDLAEACRAYRTDASFPLYEEMLHSASNWDTVDGIAASLLGGLVRSNRAHERTVEHWITDPNFWVRRAALLVHLKHKKETNTALLEKTIVALMHEKEFFIRKAIGWVLREYAKTDPAWVRRFVARHEKGLSPLSKREAMKHLE
ncbi:MAG: DNA alkylation repair protein [Candidatus Hydrogenedentes bacterium]|nr:DNA alkylation repair protein [Candidatus Hydrogenedentota bacterium]